MCGFTAIQMYCFKGRITKLVREVTFVNNEVRTLNRAKQQHGPTRVSPDNRLRRGNTGQVNRQVFKKLRSAGKHSF